MRVAIAFVVACGSGGHAPPRANDAAVARPAPADAAPLAAPDAAPPAHVRTGNPGTGMFVAGNSWRYQIDGGDLITCRVGDVTPFRGGSRSVIRCDGKLPGTVAGAWASTPHGLYYLGAPPADGFDVDDVELPFPPKESSRDQEYNEGMLGTTITHTGDQWCVDDSTSSQGDSDDATTCYDADGIASYTYQDTAENDDGPDTVTKRRFARVPP